MVLDWQNVVIPLGGIDTKTDDKQVQPGKTLLLENGQFSKAGQINKRFGYDILSTRKEGGDNISAGQALSAFNDELLLFDGSNVYSYLESTSHWSNRGTAVSVITQDQTILRNDHQQLNPDVAILNGIEVYVWEDSSGGVRYSVLDSVTKALIMADQNLYVFGEKPKALAFQNQVLLTYTDGANNLFYQLINPAQPTQISVSNTLATDGYAGFSYDLAVIGDKLFLGYLNDSAHIVLDRFDSASASPLVTTVATGAHALNGLTSCLSVVGDTSFNAWIAWGTGADVRAACYSFTLSLVLAETLIATGLIDTIAAFDIGSAMVQIVVEQDNAVSSNHRVSSATISQSGAVAGIGELRSVGLASKPFSYNGNHYVNVAFDSPLQPTYFTVLLNSAPFSIIAKAQPSTGGGLRSNNMLSEVVETSPGIFTYANLDGGKPVSEAGVLFSLEGVNSTSLDFVHPNKFLSVAISNNLLFVGGILQTYDGQSAVELGFHVYPEGVTTIAGGSNGQLSDGAYQYVAQYQWTDNRGNVQISAGSVPVSVTVTALNHVRVTVPTLRLTAKQAERNNVRIVIYRTLANQTQFFRVTSAVAPFLNNTGVDSVTFEDLSSDADIGSNELLNTTGGVLDNIAPPASSLITLFQNRVILGGLEDPNLLWFSKNKFDNTSFNTIPVEFAAELTIGCDARGGKITALSVINGNLIIFKESAIFKLAGDGPNDTGAGDQFPDPELITSDVGCDNPNSIAFTPIGLMFKTAKGLYLLDQSLTVSYLGAPAEAYNGLTISSATLNQIDNQVIFTTMEGPAIVYDYFFQQWSTWTNHQCEDSDSFNNLFCFIRPNGKVYLQNRESFTDGGASIVLSLVTPNLSFADLQGYRQVRRVYLLGSYKGPHTLNVQVAYNFDSAYQESATIDATQGTSVWGGDATWGAGPFWGGEYQIYEFCIYLKNPRCTAIRLKISDSQSSDYNEGYAISSLSFRVGTLPGQNRLPATQTKGTT